MTTTLRSTLLLVLAAAAIAMALLITGALGGASPSSAGAATVRHQAATGAEATGPDTDNVQAGDQSAPDSPSEPAESATEASPASEASGAEGLSAEPACGAATPGHEDPQGSNVDHQCPPACAPGELP